MSVSVRAGWQTLDRKTCRKSGDFLEALQAVDVWQAGSVVGHLEIYLTAVAAAATDRTVSCKHEFHGCSDAAEE